MSAFMVLIVFIGIVVVVGTGALIVTHNATKAKGLKEANRCIDRIERIAYNERELDSAMSVQVLDEIRQYRNRELR